MRNLFRREPQPVVAAASVASKSDTLDKTSVMAREINEAWQTWRLVGEIHYATGQQSRLVSRVRWDIFIDGKQMPEKAAEDIMRAAFGKGLKDYAEQSAIHMQVAGGYHFVRLGEKDWRVLPSPPDHRAKLVISDASIIIKNVNPDPRDPTRTDSPVLAALDVSRELILARAQSRAASRNRTAQLNTVIYPLEGAGPDPAKFEKDFTRVMTAPLVNELSESVVVPNLVGFQGDWIEKWKAMDLTGPIDKNLHEKIPVLVNQLAVILDIPPQILLGMSDLNHWAAWAVQEDNWFGHVEPLARRVGDGLALALAKATDMDPESVEVMPDPAPLLKRRPSLDNIIEAFKEGIVNGKFSRVHLGADEGDAPAEGDSNEGGSSSEGEGEPDTEQDGGALPKAAAAEPAAPSVLRLAEIDIQVLDSLEDLVTDTAERALDRLGARVRSISQGKDIGVEGADALSNVDLALRFEGAIPNQESVITSVVASSLGRFNRVIERGYERVRALNVDVKADEADLQNARELYQSLTADHISHLLKGRPGIEWEIGRRLASIVGGSGDLAVAAAVMRNTDSGIALGRRSLAALRDQFGVVPGQYVWLHQTRGPNEHPEHRELDGEVFNGQFILKNGINWFPGDHSGCRCVAMPELVKVG